MNVLLKGKYSDGFAAEEKKWKTASGQVTQWGKRER